MASDLISREALVEKTEILYQHTESGKIIPWSAVRVCEINNIPAVDAEPVRHGEWEWLGPNSMVSGCMCGTCSVCKVRSKYIVNVGICPNCGAKMGMKEDS